EGRCERCEAVVTIRDLEQWFFRITDYADRLLERADEMDGWPDRVKTMQRNWIGRSEGVEIDFTIAETGQALPCFTTRADTIFGVTYMVMAAEHAKVRELVAGTEHETGVLAFAERVKTQGAFERGAADVVKEGIWTGCHVVNPVNGEKAPLWIANYVLMEYGTGAVMAVPAHDQRDFEFARAYELPVRVVIDRPDGSLDADGMDEAYVEDGIQTNSAQFDGLPNREGIERIADWMEERGIGRRTVSYRLRDWLVSRQRYWGTPIPIIYCETCGPVAVPEDELPVLLPTDVEFTGKGESPLTTSKTFLDASCPKCGAPGRRESDTLDTFVDSSWYLMRYIDARNDERPFVKEHVDRWFPVDQYVGGVEHACGHLIFVRFMTKVLKDLGLLSFDEPIERLFSQGMIYKDGQKMSKSRGNVVSPDELIDRYGADTERLYTLFAGPPDRDAEWNDTAVEGSFRFLNRVWHLVGERPFAAGGLDAARANLSVDGLADGVVALHRKTHQTIRKVTLDMEAFHFNTAIAAVMELVNATRAFTDALGEQPTDTEHAVVAEALEAVTLLLGPMVPHFAEEIWERMGGSGTIFHTAWPSYDEQAAKEDVVTIAVQINGKLRGDVDVERGASEDVVVELARANEKVARHLEGKTVRRIIFVPDRLLNIVVG
ncbi:leucine--tRNA ligase, partial [bacterium]|nr:leucine--tRNA ligase [bacterium]